MLLYFLAIAILAVLLLREFDRRFDQTQLIVNQNKKIMALFDEILEDIKVMADSTANIAADLVRIADQIQGGLTKEQAETVRDAVKERATKLKELADLNPEPEEPEGPEESGEPAPEEPETGEGAEA